MKRSNSPIHLTIGDILFCFEYIYTPADTKFFVTAASSKDLQASFEIKTDAFGKWNLVEPIPSWIQPWKWEIIDALTMNLRFLPAA